MSPLTRLPYWSSTRTVTAGVMTPPTVAPVGCWPNASWLAAAALTATAAGPVIALLDASLTVTVWLPADTRVTPPLKVCDPLSSPVKV